MYMFYRKKFKSLICMFNYMYIFIIVYVLLYLFDENCYLYFKYYDNKGYSLFLVFGFLLRCLKLLNVMYCV